MIEGRFHLGLTLAGLLTMIACSPQPAATGPSPTAATAATATATSTSIAVAPPTVDPPASTSATAAPPPVSSTPFVKPGDGTPLRVFFMGNSLTMMNSLPKMVAKLSSAETPSIVVGQNADPKESLTQHLKHDGLKWEKKRWSVFVLQERTNAPLEAKDEMVTAMKGLDAQVREGTGRTVIFETWADHAHVLADQAKIRAAYDDAAKQIGAKVAPVGDAFVVALKKTPAPDLYDPDGKHASLRGTYLAACVFYGFFYGKTPVGLPGPEGATIDPKELTLLQESAWAALKATPAH